MKGETVTQNRAKLARKALRLNARCGRGLPSLVLMTDDTLVVDWVEAVRALPRGSAVVVRHREARAREALALGLRVVCDARGVKLLIADDVKLAVRLRADGVHLPQARMAKVGVARAQFGLVTVSAHDRAAVARACVLGADAVFVSPVFATASHAERGALGVVRFAAMSAGCACPVYALGGIDANSINRLGGLRLAGVALMRGWLAPICTI
ncbi:MAG: thiamine phosphate synthase [Alphaproteobacteria bacterium]|nr:thiamine phosphate synthase [Alphaproteobacteria bacterium]